MWCDASGDYDNVTNVTSHISYVKNDHVTESEKYKINNSYELNDDISRWLNIDICIGIGSNIDINKHWLPADRKSFPQAHRQRRIFDSTQPDCSIN